MRGFFLRRLLVLGNLFWRREEGSRAKLDFGEEKWRLAEILNPHPSYDPSNIRDEVSSNSAEKLPNL